MRNPLTQLFYFLYLSMLSLFTSISRSWYQIIILVGLFGGTPTWAQNNLLPVSDAGLEMNGLVIDDTMSKLGREFYDLFYTRWDVPRSSMPYTVCIKEQLQPGRRTRISVLLDDNEVMNQVLQPRQELLLALANKAIELIRYQILNYQQMARQLENEDLFGSGIF